MMMWVSCIISLIFVLCSSYQKNFKWSLVPILGIIYFIDYILFLYFSSEWKYKIHSWYKYHLDFILNIKILLNFMTSFWQFIFKIIFKNKTTIIFMKSSLLVVIFLSSYRQKIFIYDYKALYFSFQMVAINLNPFFLIKAIGKLYFTCALMFQCFCYVEDIGSTLHY